MEAAAHAQLAELEGRHWWLRGRRTVYLGLLAHHLRGARPARVLDLGCGSGGFARGLAHLGARVFGADPCRAGLARCAAEGTPALQARCERLPFRAGSLDLVCLFDVLEHLDEDGAALREVARVLRPGGLLFASVPAYPFLFADNDRVAHHRRRYTRRALARALEAAGLRVERLTHANALLLPLIVPAVLALQALERLRPGAPPRHTNLAWPLPRAAHALLYRAFAAELPLARRWDLPAGHSIAAIARRPA